MVMVERQRPERIGVAELARVIGGSRRKVQMLAAAGRIPSAARLGGGAWSFNEKAVRAWIREEEEKTARSARALGTLSRAPDADSAYEKLFVRRNVSRAKKSR